MAVTRDGIPVRLWCWPWDTADSALIRQVKDDMRDWTLSKIVWVAGRGFASARNRRDRPAVQRDLLLQLVIHPLPPSCR
jgi:hypothetical protein